MKEINFTPANFTPKCSNNVEAKQNNFMAGWGQCLAELLAMQKLNQDETFPV